MIFAPFIYVTPFLFLAGIINFILAFIVLFKHRKSEMNIIFCLLCLCFSLWCIVVGIVSSGFSPLFLLIGGKGMVGAGIFMPLFVLLFSKVFPRNEYTLDIRKVFFLSLPPVIFSCLLILTKELANPIITKEGNLFLRLGVAHHFFIIYCVCYAFVGIRNLYRGFRNSVGIERMKYKYLFLGLLLASAIGIFCNLILVFFDIPSGVYFGPLGSVFLVALTAYAIIRYHLMDIETVIHHTILWLIALSLLIVPVGIVYGYFKEQIFSLSAGQVVSLVSITLLIFAGYYYRLKPRIDHFFRRRKYDYQFLLTALPDRVGTWLDINLLLQNLFRELQTTLYVRNGLVIAKGKDSEIFREIGSFGYEKLQEEGVLKGKASLSFSSSDPLIVQLGSQGKAVTKEIEPESPGFAVKEEVISLCGQAQGEVLVPLFTQGKIIGILCLGKKVNLQEYAPKDLELLEKINNSLGNALDNALHHGDIVEKERLAEELKLGQEIQMNLLPKTVPEVAGLKLQGLMIPAKEIGGDYYDFLELEANQRLAVVIGDVSGKGVGAGLIMATAKSTIEAITRQNLTPKELLSVTNKLLGKYTKHEKFMTMLYLEWIASEKRLKYSSAGHEHIIIYRKNGKLTESLKLNAFQLPAFSIQQPSVEVIRSGGIMLGVLPDIEPMLEDKELLLNSGDKIVIYTDGVTEAHDEQGKMYELPRLVESVSKHSDKSGEHLLQALKDDVYAFMGKQEQYDDITIVVMEAT